MCTERGNCDAHLFASYDDVPDFEGPLVTRGRFIVPSISPGEALTVTVGGGGSVTNSTTNVQRKGQNMSQHSEAYLRRRIEVLQEELERKLMAKSVEDNFKVGDVLRVNKVWEHNGREYTFILLKTPGGWYNTANNQVLANRLDWTFLVQWFGVDNMLAAQKVGSWKKAF
jgi:hypothetical protein